MRRQTIHHTHALSEAAVQGSGLLLEATLLRAGASRNGTYYPDATLRDAAAKFTGVRCYCDHAPADGDRPATRSVAELVGRVEEAWYADGAIHGRIRLSKTQGWLETLLSEGLAGDLSIAAVGTTRVGRQGEGWYRIVEAIHEAHAVDFVTEAAAGGRVERLLHESRAEEQVARDETYQLVLGPESGSIPGELPE